MQVDNLPDASSGKPDTLDLGLESERQDGLAIAEEETATGGSRLGHRRHNRCNPQSPKLTSFCLVVCPQSAVKQYIQ